MVIVRLPLQFDCLLAHFLQPTARNVTCLHYFLIEIVHFRVSLRVFWWVALRLHFLLLKIFCKAHQSSCVMLRDFSFSLSSLSYSFVPPRASILSILPLELAPRVSRRLHPVQPSDTMSSPEAEGVQSFRHHNVVERDHVSQTRTEMEGAMFQATDSQLHDGGTQKTFNQQPTVPPDSHSRPVFFNQTHRQFVIRHLSLSGHTQGTGATQFFRQPKNPT